LARGFYNDFLAAQPNARSRAAIEGWLRELEPCAAAEDAAERERMSAEHRDVAPPPKPRAIDRGKSLRLAGVLVSAAGGVSLIVGAGYLLDSRSKQADYSKLCPGADCDLSNPTFAALDRDGRAANAIATAGFIVGGVMTAAGVGLYVWGRTRVETVVVEPRPGGATVSAELRF